MKVLIVEDDLKIASFIEKGLKEAGFIVDSAVNGEQALRYCGPTSLPWRLGVVGS